MVAVRAKLACRCGREHWVQGSQAGSRITCTCGSMIEVPTLRVLQQFAGQTPRPAQQVEHPRPTPSTAMAKVFSGVLAVAALGCAAVAGALWFARFQIDTRRTPEDYLQAGRDAIDRMTPEEALALWRYYRDQGLTHESIPEPLRNWAVATQLTRWALGVTLAASVLVGLAIVTTVWASRHRNSPSNAS